MKHDKKSKAERTPKTSRLARTVERTGLPIDILRGCPYIQIYGAGTAVIEGECAILDYDEQKLKLRCGKEELCIEGYSLCVNMLDNKALAVGGKIHSISFGT